MVDTLAQEVRLNGQQKRMIIVLFVVIVILLLLWLRSGGARGGDVTNNITNKAGDTLPGLSVDPQYVNYNVPGLDIPGLDSFRPGGNFDWLNTTDCMCNCDEDWHPQTLAAIVSTQYAYLAGPTLPPVAPINFPVYMAPPLPEWWYEPGYNVHHEQARYVYTSDGVNGILGKYSRSAWNDPMKRSGYNQQTKSVTLQGDDAYIDGRHYKHNPNKDRNWPASVPSYVGYASVSSR